MKSIPISRAITHYCGMPERVRRKRRLLVFSAFFDESGTDPKLNKALVFGGFLGRVDLWERVSEAWDKCTRGKPYKHKNADESQTLALANTIARFKDLRGVCVTVSHSWFVHRDAKASKGMIGARVYDWGFGAATGGVMQYLDDTEPGDEKVDFVFDERNELRACISTYYYAKNHPLAVKSVRRGGECAPGNDEEIAALQMADLLAGELSADVNAGKRSNALEVIRLNNKIIHIPCAPPRQLPNTLKLQKLARQVRIQAGD